MSGKCSSPCIGLLLASADATRDHPEVRETDGKSTQRVKITATDRTRMVRGIRARVLHDVVREKGELVENTFDWYAQDSGCSIWYLGENTHEYENDEVVSDEGSWEYGVDGARRAS